MSGGRDMTKAQFRAACERAGFEPQGYLGYYRLPLGADRHCCVSVYNAGTRRRDQLAYLHAELAKREGRASAPAIEENGR